MIDVKFESKEPVVASTIFSTRKFNKKIIAKFFNVQLKQVTVKVTGIWYYIDNDGQERKINDITFEFPSSQMTQIEHQMGNINTKNIFFYVNTRIKQIFPLILDQEIALDPEANFGLSSGDIKVL